MFFFYFLNHKFAGSHPASSFCRSHSQLGSDSLKVKTYPNEKVCFMWICQDTDNYFMYRQFSTWTSPLQVELNRNVRVSGIKWELGHGNHLVWKIVGKVGKVAYSFCLLVTLWEQQESARISYSFIVLDHCLRTVVHCWCGVILEERCSGATCCGSWRLFPVPFWHELHPDHADPMSISEKG